MLDTNNNGIIEIEELKKVLDEKNFNLSEDKIKIIRDYLDTNCSGYIDYT
jgi:Ca2+-binding EF-hand superfamily protein